MRTTRFVGLTAALVGATLVLIRVGAGQDLTPVDLIVWGGPVVTADAAGRVFPVGAVAIAGGRIVAVGEADAIMARYSAPDRIDARGHIVLPGLINTHTHAPMVLFRGMADDLALMDWLEHYIFPAEALTVSPDMVRIGTRLAALEMIESGTTTFADMYYFEADIARATEVSGLRAVLGQSVIGFPVADAPTPADGLARADRFLAEWADHPLITPAVAPHAAYTLDAESLREARAVADRHGAPVLIHLAETEDELGVVREAHGTTPTRYLDTLGLWSGPALAAHGVWLDDGDMAVLAARGVGLAHNPESNMKLASGIADVPGWLDAGIRAGLGTDGAASNNDLDMFDAMRTTALLHKVATGDPQAMPAPLVLDLATRGGAAALGLGAEIGSLEAGKAADLIVVSVEGARQTPMFDPVSHLVYVSRGADVRHTIVAGRILMRDGQVLSLPAHEVLRDARAMAEQIRMAVAGQTAGAAEAGAGGGGR